MIPGSLSYILMKAAFTAVIAAAFWYARNRWRKVPNAEKAALAFAGLMFVAMALVYAGFEWMVPAR